MKGLLLKDFFTLSKQMGIFILIIALFACLPELGMGVFAVIYSAMLPMTALGYDERSKWDSLALMMPYSAKDVVLSKYILGYIGVLFATLLSLASSLVGNLLKGAEFKTEVLFLPVLFAFLATVMLSIAMPLMFRLGAEKGRLTLFIIIGGVTAIGAALGELANMTVTFEWPVMVYALAALGVTLVINIVSIAVSTQVYKNRER